MVDEQGLHVSERPVASIAALGAYTNQAIFNLTPKQWGVFDQVKMLEISSGTPLAARRGHADLVPFTRRERKTQNRAALLNTF